MSVRKHFPKSRFSKLIESSGGVSRDEAVKAATQRLETMRPQTDQEIGSKVARLETMVAAAKKGDNGEATMRALLSLCDQIVTLAGSYGYGALDKASRSLCDLLMGLIGAGKSDIASIQVHVETIHLLAPGGAPLGEEKTAIMLSELTKLLDYHGLSSQGEIVP